MSRGHGTAQRFVLAQLDSIAGGEIPWMRARTLARKRRPDGGTPTRAELETIARAARRLAEAGLVDLGYYVPGPPDDDGNETPGMLRREPGKGELVLRAAPEG